MIVLIDERGFNILCEPKYCTSAIRGLILNIDIFVDCTKKSRLVTGNLKCENSGEL